MTHDILTIIFATTLFFNCGFLALRLFFPALQWDFLAARRPQSDNKRGISAMDGNGRDEYGLRELYTPPAGTRIDLDIIAIHGIAAHPDRTWCKKYDTEKGEQQELNWLSDQAMLPSAVQNARIMRYGYPSQWFGNNVIRQNVTSAANRFLTALKIERQDCERRPLLIIAHCVGGLVVVQALIYAQRNPKRWPNIYHATTGIVFFGTPFRGAEQVIQKEMIQAAQAKYKDMVQPEVLRITQPEDEMLLALVHDFEEIQTKSQYPAKLTCFYEQKPYNKMPVIGETRMSFRVSKSSACLDTADCLGLARTHFDMNKFGGPNEEDFKVVKEVIRNMKEASTELIANRFQALEPEKDKRRPQLNQGPHPLFSVTGSKIDRVTGSVDHRLYAAGRDISIGATSDLPGQLPGRRTNGRKRSRKRETQKTIGVWESSGDDDGSSD